MHKSIKYGIVFSLFAPISAGTIVLLLNAYGQLPSHIAMDILLSALLLLGFIISTVMIIWGMAKSEEYHSQAFIITSLIDLAFKIIALSVFFSRIENFDLTIYTSIPAYFIVYTIAHIILHKRRA